MRVVLPLMLILALSACGMPQGAGGPQTAASSAPCVKTEQRGCLELDLLNLQAQPNLNVAAMPNRGQALYDMYVNGMAQAGKPRSFRVFAWNVNDVPVSAMAEYRLGADYPSAVKQNRAVRRTTMLTPLPVTPASMQGAPAFDPRYNIGPPQKAFRAFAPHGGVGLQFPKAMLRPNTYLLICAENAEGEGVYPNRLNGALDGFWLTPEIMPKLISDYDFYIIPFTFKDKGMPAPQGVIVPTS